MPDARKEKKPKKDGKAKRTTGPGDELSLDAFLPITAPATPGNMPPPPPSYPPSQQMSSKVAIPRLRHDTDGQFMTALVGGDHNRVAHACESCRHRKTKCSGERPKCKHCEDFKLQCVYVDGKRDRARKELGSMAEKLEEYEKLLREISPHMDPIFRQRITRALDREISPATNDVLSESPGSAHHPVAPSLPRGPAMGEPTEPYGEHYANARAGSTDSVDKITEDFNRDAASRATGYYGKNSEITWLQRLKQQAEQTEEENQNEDAQVAAEALGDPSVQDARASSLSAINGFTYHCDDLPLSITDLQVDPYEPPAEHVADLLFQSYLDTVHPTFPIVGKTTFMGQYKEYFAMHIVPNDNWLAILNLILALGARYAHLTGTQWTGDTKDHLIYFTRARMLGFNTDSVLSHAELQRVQISGLTAFYLMATSQINRSWAISGIALRHATTLGLNLRNHSTAVKEFSKEIRYRVWWALCYLERQLAVMTGRTPSVLEVDCTCPLPLPVDESGIVDNPMLKHFSSHSSAHGDSRTTTPSSAQSYGIMSSPADSHPSISLSGSQLESFPPSVGLYFLHYTEISIFTNHVLSRLYRAVDMEKTWAETQSTMAKLNVELEKWRKQLPLPFDFTKRMRDQRWIRQRKSLGFVYYSTMLIINRPCLCRMDRRIINKSDRARNFDQATAAKCVHAAIDLLNLLPDEPNPAVMYAQCAWWCLVHHLVEAAVVCMLELSYRATHMPDEVDEIFESADKAVQWLRSMASRDLAASRAWQMCDEMLRKIAPKVGKSVSDMLSFQQQAAEPMQGLQSFNTQANAMRLGAHPFQGSGAFHIPMFANYDQMLSYDQIPQTVLPTSTDDSYANMFPSASEMDAMSFGVPSADGFPPNQNPSQHQWYPLGGQKGG